ncbi:hypothetical protein [Arthrobacter sp. NIO-1057]|uniref:hypothetical protein n=1 Tax=Arthrobacter sp. NIO-1057 TaxID=993071 RepID=UPI00114797FD|nr:hypothetical protein [Arthrobacter sp. NIO-1057]
MACQSRENTTCSPAAAGSFAVLPARQIRIQVMLGMVAASVFLLVACTSTTPQASEQESTVPQAQAPSTPYAPPTGTPKANPTKAPEDGAPQLEATKVPSNEPSPKVEKSADYNGVAFEADEGHLPVVKRSGEAISAADRMPTTMKDATEASYQDGVSIKAVESGNGIVKSEGPGYFTGARYRVYEVSISNGSDEELDISNVIINLVPGNEQQAALPLYGEVEAYDFSGAIAAGKQASAHYAFIVQDAGAVAKLQVDLDNQHAPALLTLKAEKK